MGNPSGFISLRRKKAPKRPVEERVKDYQEVEGNFSDDELRDQAARCMDCGVP